MIAYMLFFVFLLTLHSWTWLSRVCCIVRLSDNVSVTCFVRLPVFVTIYDTLHADHVILVFSVVIVVSLSV